MSIFSVFQLSWAIFIWVIWIWSIQPSVLTTILDSWVVRKLEQVEDKGRGSRELCGWVGVREGVGAGVAEWSLNRPIDQMTKWCAAQSVGIPFPLSLLKWIRGCCVGSKLSLIPLTRSILLNYTTVVYQQMVIAALLRPNSLVSFPRIAFPEALRLRIRGCFRTRKNSCNIMFASARGIVV